ncbi:MAG TPA: hypothetical protein V6D05_04170 [Stenomitos sp.]
MRYLKRITPFLALLAALLALPACQPARPLANPAQPEVASTASGLASVTIQVALPRSSQALVSNTQSVQVLLRGGGAPDQTATVNTGGATAVTFKGLPSGPYTLYAAGWSGTNASGTMMSWGRMPVTLTSGTNNLALSLSVAVRSGAGADSLVNGPAGNGAAQLGYQRIFTSMNDLSAGTASSVEVFYPGQNTYLSRFGSAGNLNGQFSTHIQMLTIDSKDRIWVSDDTHHRVQQFDLNGTFLRGIGSDTAWSSASAAPAPAVGITNYGFNAPAGVMVDRDDNLYVADRANRRIMKYDPNGTFIMGFGYNTAWSAPAAAPAVQAYTNANGYFEPYGIDVDPANNVYIADRVGNRMHIFNSSGKFVRGIGQGVTWAAGAAPPATTATGSTPSWFNSSWHIRLDDAGTMYTTDGSDRVQVFDPNGNFLRQWSCTTADKPGGSAGYFDLSPQGLLYVAAYGGTPNFYQVFTPQGTLLSRFGIYGAAAGQMMNPEGIAWASDGTFFTVDRDASRIDRWKGVNLTDSNGGLRLTGDRTPDVNVYAASGTYDTPSVDGGSPSTTWGTVLFNVGALPAGTGVAVSVATSNDNAAWSGWTSVAGAAALGNNVRNLVGITGRYLKVRLTLTTGNTAVSPEVQDVGVTY